MTALTRPDELYIAECLLSRARHLSRKLTQAERRGRPLHPELERKMREDVTECTRLALLMQAQRRSECHIYTHDKMCGAVSKPDTPCEG